MGVVERCSVITGDGGEWKWTSEKEVVGRSEKFPESISDASDSERRRGVFLLLWSL